MYFFIYIIYVIYYICLRTSYPQMAKSLSFPSGVPMDLDNEPKPVPEWCPFIGIYLMR